MTSPAAAAPAAPAPGTAISPAESFSLAELAGRAESTSLLLRRIEADLTVDPVTNGVEDRLSGLTDEITARLDERKMLIAPGASLDTLRTLEREWAELGRQLSNWAGDLAAHAAELERDDGRLAGLGIKWRRTLDDLHASGAEAAVLERVESISRQIGEARARIGNRAARVGALQGRVAAQDVRVADALSAIREAQSTAVNRLLQRDGAPLWGGRLGSEARQDLAEHGRYSFARQWEATWAYARRHTIRVAIHAALVAVLALGASRVCRGWGDRLKTDPDTARSSAVFRMPVATAVVATIPLVPWLYPQGPRLFLAILGGAMLAPAILVLRHVVLRSLLPLLYALAAFYAVGLAVSVTESLPALSRTLFLAEMIGGVVLLAWFLRSAPRATGFQEIAGTRHWALVHAAVKVALAAMAASALANVLGFVSLSRLIGDAVLTSAFVAIMLDGFVRVAHALLGVAIYVRPVAALGMVRRHGRLLRRRLTWALALAAGLLWASITLEALSARRAIVDRVEAALTARWGVGAVNLSLGGLVAFAAAVAGSFLLSRLVRFLLDEDVYPRVHLARGIPNAISTMLHYAILFLGFLVAVAALGYDMTKFTILAGAFGVGLGFGMQNIVNNFVSGLILLFERPIQVGDVIELDPATVGVVARIGIRASVLRTPSAAEVIVPNGMLIANRVTNWTLTNRQRGFEIPLSVAGGVDPAVVIDLLIRVARDSPRVAAAPAPQAYVTEFLPAGGLKFELRVWTDRFDDWVQARSDLVAAIHAALAGSGFHRM